MHFKEAIKNMLDVGEFEKIIANAKGKDKKAAKEFYSLIKGNEDFNNIPSIVLLTSIHSVSVLADAISFMEQKDKPVA